MRERNEVTGVILAAGFSRRLGRPKQLLPLAGKPLLQYAIDAANGACLSEVLVVLGEGALLISPAIDPGRARLIENPLASGGQSTSIVAGVVAANPTRIGTLLMLGDQPGVTTDDLNHVVSTFDGQPDSIAMASWQGILRSPVVFGRSYDAELLALTGDEGARPLVLTYIDRVRLAEFDRPVPVDIDTDADYRRVLEHWASVPHKNGA